MPTERPTSQPTDSDPEGLGWDRKDDPSLYDMYAKKLLIRGWAGSMSPAEKAYLRRKNPPWYAAAMLKLEGRQITSSVEAKRRRRAF
jgi:hypothetical protein